MLEAGRKGTTMNTKDIASRLQQSSLIATCYDLLQLIIFVTTYLKLVQNIASKYYAEYIDKKNYLIIH